MAAVIGQKRPRDCLNLLRQVLPYDLFIRDLTRMGDGKLATTPRTAETLLGPVVAGSGQNSGVIRGCSQ